MQHHSIVFFKPDPDRALAREQQIGRTAAFL
jgi:hypothetical protein